MLTDPEHAPVSYGFTRGPPRPPPASRVSRPESVRSGLSHAIRYERLRRENEAMHVASPQTLHGLALHGRAGKGGDGARNMSRLHNPGQGGEKWIASAVSEKQPRQKVLRPGVLALSPGIRALATWVRPRMCNC